jgi:hypothetical protein
MKFQVFFEKRNNVSRKRWRREELEKKVAKNKKNCL